MELTDGQEIWIGFVSLDRHEPVVYAAAVISAEHRIVRRPWRVDTIQNYECVFASEAAAYAALAAQIREQARTLDAKADAAAAKAAGLGVGPAKPE